MSKENNIAFIDAQNLHMGIQVDDWKLDYKKFRTYLRDKYRVEEAYIFLGFLDEEQSDLYKNLQKAGFIVEFREHTSHMKGKKKGNVDVDIVFEVMKRMLDEDDFDKIILVSGDGDYIKMVKYLIEKNRLKKIIFPNNKYSSLYRPMVSQYGSTLSLPEIQKKLIHKKRRCP